MIDTERINMLYNNVLNRDISEYGISVKEITNSIEVMYSVYNKENTSLNSRCLNLADYNDPAHRCAYLHKYAALHTTMVRDMMYSAVQLNFNFFHEIVFSSKPFTMCSLGGGPGTDVIGALAALQQSFSFIPTSVTIIDYMTNWKNSFHSILRELGNGFYGAFGNNTYFLNWSYLGADLLQETFPPDVQDVLSQASLVTMIKFASAAACVDTPNMIENIFMTMKPGAVLLFIDNDGGGFHELIMNEASRNNFISIFGPIRHENYRNDNVKVKRFGYMSCHKTTITVHILQKPVYFDANPIPSRPVLLERTLLLESPFANYDVPIFQTPYSPTMSPYTAQLTPDQLLGRFDYASDERIYANNFISPSVAIPQSPSQVLVPSYIRTPLGSDIVNSPYFGNNLTPGMLPRSIKKGKLGCLPLKRWRSNLARKINVVKSRATSLLRKKRVKKSHPVFRL